MKKLLSILFLLPLPLQAGYVHKITASAQGVVDGSYSQAKRIGSTYSMSSTGITAGTMGHLDSPALDNSSVLTGVAATHGTGSYTQTTAGRRNEFFRIIYSRGCGSYNSKRFFWRCFFFTSNRRHNYIFRRF